MERRLSSGNPITGLPYNLAPFNTIIIGYPVNEVRTKDKWDESAPPHTSTKTESDSASHEQNRILTKVVQHRADLQQVIGQQSVKSISRLPNKIYIT